MGLGVSQTICLAAEERRARIEAPWRRMNQFRSLDWGNVRLSMQRRLAYCMQLDSCLVQRELAQHFLPNSIAPPGGYVGVDDGIALVNVHSTKNGALRLVSQHDICEWLSASLLGDMLHVVVVGVDKSDNMDMDECCRRSEETCESGWHSVAQPVISREDGKWLVGEISPQEVRLLHWKSAPKWPTVLRYAMQLEQQVACGCFEGPPPVQISRHLLHGDWVVHDGAHRLYAALLSGLPLQCKWKRQQCKREDLSDEKRSSLQNMLDAKNARR